VEVVDGKKCRLWVSSPAWWFPWKEMVLVDGFESLQNPRFFSISPESITCPDFYDLNMFDQFWFLQNHLKGLCVDGTNVQFEFFYHHAVKNASDLGFSL
jgi:hypothetical protein